MKLDVTDEQLKLARLKNRFKNMEPLLSATAPYVKEVLKFKVPSSDVDDLAQEIMCKIITNLCNLKSNDAYKAWVNSLIRNCFASFWSNHVSHQMEDIDDEESQNSSHQYTPEDQLIQSEREVELNAAMLMLSEQERLVLEQRYTHGLKIDEIAMKLKRPSGTVRRWLHEAKDHLREQLEP